MLPAMSVHLPSPTFVRRHNSRDEQSRHCLLVLLGLSRTRSPEPYPRNLGPGSAPLALSESNRCSRCAPPMLCKPRRRAHTLQAGA